MPVATPFSTYGVYNGLPDCLPSVDVSGFDFWTTASGYNKDSVGEPTQSQIDQSIQLAGKLFWNLYRITCATGQVSIPSSILDEVIVSGWDAPELEPEPDPIEPEKRVCSGSLTRGGDLFPILADVDLTLERGFARMYDGDTADEGNFIGYGSGLIDWNNIDDEIAPIAQWVIDLFIDPQSHLGGYSNDDVGSGRLYEYTYIEREGIHFLWLGVIDDASTLGPNVESFIDSDNLRVWLEVDEVVEDQAQITGLEFYTYA